MHNANIKKEQVPKESVPTHFKTICCRPGRRRRFCCRDGWSQRLHRKSLRMGSPNTYETTKASPDLIEVCCHFPFSFTFAKSYFFEYWFLSFRPTVDTCTEVSQYRNSENKEKTSDLERMSAVRSSQALKQSFTHKKNARQVSTSRWRGEKRCAEQRKIYFQRRPELSMRTVSFNDHGYTGWRGSFRLIFLSCVGIWYSGFGFGYSFWR